MPKTSIPLAKFDRYGDAPTDDDTGVRMPLDILDAKVSTLSISEVIGRLERFTAGGSDGPEMYPWADRFVMGFPLPSWQRPLVWTREQKVRFIASIWSGVDIGSYMVNDQYKFIGIGTDKVHYQKFSEVLLDGQQRLNAIQGYLLNEFSVEDATGVARYWSDLPRRERRRFGGFHFARANIKSWDEGMLRLAYDLRSFGGTAHTEDQRAS